MDAYLSQLSESTQIPLRRSFPSIIVVGWSTASASCRGLHSGPAPPVGLKVSAAASGMTPLELLQPPAANH